MGQDLRFGGYDLKELTDNPRVKLFSVLLGIFLIAFATRYITKHQLLFDPDSYWWYQLAMYFADISNHGHLQYFSQEGGKTLYELRYYPTSKPLESGLLILPMAIGYSYKVLVALGAPQTPQGMLNYMFFFGPFFGALTAVMAYFLGRELTHSHRAGFIAAIFYSFSHFAMTRNTAGDTGQESLGTFFLFLMLYLFIVAVKEGEPRRAAAYSAGSGVLFILAANTWGGTFFYWGLIASSVFAFLAIKVALDRPLKEYRSATIAFPIFIAVGVLFPAVTGIGKSYVIGPISIASQFQNLSYLIVIFCLSLLGYEWVRRTRSISLKPRSVFLAAAVVVLIGVLITGKFTIIERIFEFIHKLIFTPGEKGLTGQTVAYYRSTGIPELKNTFGVLLLAIPAGLLFLGYEYYRKRDFYSLFMIVFLILGLVGFRYMIRLSYFLAFILPLFIGVLFATYTARQEVEIEKKPKKKKDNSEKHAKLGLFIGLAVLLVLVTPTLTSGIQMLQGQKNADRSVMPWKDAGEWIRKNTPKDALLVHWWDYGYHLQTFAVRRTIVDGGNTGPKITGNHRNVDVANAFASTEEEFYKYIKPYNPKGFPVYVLVSIAEFGKSGAINFHAKDNLYFQNAPVKKTGNRRQDQQRINQFINNNRITNYRVVDAGNRYIIWAQIITDRQGNRHPEWQKKVLPKLLPTSKGRGKNMDHFNLVYKNGYVYVYKFTP